MDTSEGTSGLVFRPAEEVDLPRVADLLREVMAEHGVRPLSEDEARASLRAALADPGHHLLLAEGAGGPVAMCALLVSFSTWQNARVCEIQDVVVTATHRGSQVGTRLLEAATSFARELGCARLYLLAESWNLRAHALYRAAGMQEKTALYFEQDLRGP